MRVKRSRSRNDNSRAITARSNGTSAWANSNPSGEVIVICVDAWSSTAGATRAAKAAKNYGEVQNAYGLSSGAMAQARLAQDNQLQAALNSLNTKN